MQLFLLQMKHSISTSNGREGNDGDPGANQLEIKVSSILGMIEPLHLSLTMQNSSTSLV